MVFFSKQQKIKLFKNGSITEIETGIFSNANTISTASQNYLCVTKPSHVKIKRKYYKAVIVEDNEFICKNFHGEYIDHNRLTQFIIDNKLYYEAKTGAEGDLYYETLSVNGKELIKHPITDLNLLLTLPSNQKIIPFVISEHDYIRAEAKLFEQSNVISATINAMSKEAHSQRSQMILYGLLVVQAVAIVIFMNGGLALLKFW